MGALMLGIDSAAMVLDVTAAQHEAQVVLPSLLEALDIRRPVLIGATLFFAVMAVAISVVVGVTLGAIAGFSKLTSVNKVSVLGSLESDGQVALFETEGGRVNEATSVQPPMRIADLRATRRALTPSLKERQAR